MPIWLLHYAGFLPGASALWHEMIYGYPAAMVAGSGDKRDGADLALVSLAALCVEVCHWLRQTGMVPALALYAPCLLGRRA